MKSKCATYSVVLRSLWLVFALAVAVLCGPVKKLIELRIDPASASSSLFADKKLKTWYRERHDIVSPVQHVAAVHDTNGDGPTAVINSAFVYFLFPSTQHCVTTVQCSRPAVVPELPLYLHISKLQV